MLVQHPINYNPYRFGYKFLDFLDPSDPSKGRHLGTDYNGGGSGYADYLMEVRPMFDGVVVHSRNEGKGWGNIIVIESTKLTEKRWNLLAHHHKNYVKEGQHVKMDDVIALVGKGHNGEYSPHEHAQIHKKPFVNWSNYPKKWSVAKINEYLEDPLLFVERINKQHALSLAVSEYAKEAVEHMKKTGIIENWDNPKKKIDAEIIEFALMKAGKLQRKTPQNGLSLEDFAVVLYREFLK